MIRVDPISGRLRVGGAGLLSLAASAALALGAAPAADAAVTSSFGAGSLYVSGDGADNTIKVTCIIGAVLVYDGAVPDNPGGGAAVACSSVTSIFVDGGNGSDAITFENLQTPQYPAAAAVTVVGGGANDTIRFALTSGTTPTTPLGATIEGGDGNDDILGTAAADTIRGDGGFDTVDGAGGDDQLAGGSDSLPTTDAPDTIRGGTGTDRLNEQLLPGAAGTDLVTVAASGTTGTLSYMGQLDTLQDVEQLKLTGSSEGEDVNLDAWALPATILGGNGSDRILLTRDVDMVGTSTINNVIGPENTSDTIVAAGGGEIAFGDLEPVVTGGPGANRLDFSGYNGRITINGAGGNDTILGATATGLGAFESVLGGAGDDSLVGNQGSDRLLGEDGDDTLVTGSTAGGLTVDSLDGGPGLDRVASSGDVSFTLSDTALAGIGSTTLVAVERASLTGGAGTSILKLEGWSGQATLDGAGAGDTYAITLTGTTTSATTIQDTGASGQDSLVLPDCTATTVTPTLVTRAGESIALGGVEGLPCGVAATPPPPPPPGGGASEPGVVPVVARVGRPLTLSKNGLAALVRVACEAAAQGTCRGSVALKATVAARAVLAKGTPRKTIRLGSAAFVDLRPGKTRSVPVALTRRGLAALARLGSLRVVVTVRASDDRGVRRATTGTRTLRARKPG